MDAYGFGWMPLTPLRLTGSSGLLLGLRELPVAEHLPEPRLEPFFETKKF